MITIRTDNTIKNSIFSVIETFINILINFISRAIFIRILGKEHLGLNGIFSSILTMLNLFELGIGSAIIFNLYKPLANNDKEKIKSLMLFYKKAFNIIALIISIVGLLLIPFLPKIIRDVTIDINITFVYILFLASTACSYLFTYKRGLIYADQKNYIINICHSIYLILLNILQLLILYLTKNYYLYLIIKIICQLIENLILYFIANKLYPYLKEKNTIKLQKKEIKIIYSKIGALFFHKIANVFVTGIDNILISYFFGVAMVGLYSNYALIVSSILTLLSQIIASSIPSIGNLLVNESSDKTYNVFKKIRFLNFYLSTLFSTCILFLIEPFIILWVGKEYLINFEIIIVVIINFFQKSMRQSFIVFKDAAGIWEEDKFIPIIESILNLIFSIIFLKLWGLAGIFYGTIASSLPYWLYSYPKFVYKKIFKRNYFQYFKETFGYLLLFLIVILCTGTITSLITISNLLLKMSINLIICFTITTMLIYIYFCKTEYFNYFEQLIKKIINSKLKN